jgi:hypothetical protein
MIISLHPEIAERAETVRLAMNNCKSITPNFPNHNFTKDEFNHYLFMLGLLQCEFEILPRLTGKSYKPYYSIQEEDVISQSGEVMA